MRVVLRGAEILSGKSISALIASLRALQPCQEPSPRRQLTASPDEIRCSHERRAVKRTAPETGRAGGRAAQAARSEAALEISRRRQVVPSGEALRRPLVRYSGLAHSSAPPEKQTHG